MSLTPDELTEHCTTILESRRIKNKIVLLCEGDIQVVKGQRSPTIYRRMETMPDSNFYKACIPTGWTALLPQFFNCGDKISVLNTYVTLLELHNKSPEKSYLSPDKLFALVDLDLQFQETTRPYDFKDTEEIFHDLYDKGKVNEANTHKHRIWVTGLIHKEAYFLHPELQDFFDNYPTPPAFNGTKLNLEGIYTAMSGAIDSDTDLADNFDRARARISYCDTLDLANTNRLKESWQREYQNASDVAQKHDLSCALLTIKKAKDYWAKIKPLPDSDWTRNDGVYREQLLLKIGKFYSQESQNSDHHIPAFFKTLALHK
ncbi:MAG: hypothetical protein GY754_23125 [bacterium]|nr:hypothetical protein [bacterium]